ncbi:VHS1067 protein [Vibrio phage 1]|nr:VHS1067 protein [Vibrio phage 1]
MASIKVRRFDGTKEGSPIVEVLATNEAALLQRGRNELDNQATDKEEVTHEIPFQSDLELYDFIEITDYSNGSKTRGRVISLTHSFSLPEAITTVTLEALA